MSFYLLISFFFVAIAAYLAYEMSKVAIPAAAIEALARGFASGDSQERESQQFPYEAGNS